MVRKIQCAPTGSLSPCASFVQRPMMPMAAPRPPICTPSLDDRSGVSSRKHCYIRPPKSTITKQNAQTHKSVSPTANNPASLSPKTGREGGDKKETHDCPVHVARRGHLHRPAQTALHGDVRDGRHCRRGDVEARRALEVDLGSCRPRCGRARVARDAQRIGKDPHRFVERRIAEPICERFRLRACVRVPQGVWVTGRYR